MSTATFFTPSPAVRLGPNHGYRIEADTALLNADLAVWSDVAAASGLSLQLWACAAPHQGGALEGVKVAEVALDNLRNDSFSNDGLNNAGLAHVDVAVPAHVPAGRSDYAMVLVLASGGAVHDFANYASRERFIAPTLEGDVRYSVENDTVHVQVERIYNPRDSDNLSGSLSLEFWADTHAHDDAPYSGECVAHVELAQIAGGQSFDNLHLSTPWRTPSAWNSHLTLHLREWNGQGGYVTRDVRSFALPLIAVAEQARDAQEAPVMAASLSQPVTAAAPADEPAIVNEPATAAPQNVPVSLPAKAEPVLAAPVEPISKVVAAPAVEAPLAPVAKAPPAAPAAKTAAVPAKPAETARVSISSASVEALTAVPGLNRKLAAEIVKARPFKSLDELVRVRGIGPRLLQTLRAQLSL